MKNVRIFNKIMSVVLAMVMVVSMLPMSVFAAGSVAKVGNTEYATIDEAIANWTNGTTLTLLSDVTLSDVIKLSSTEYHILDLGTYTMTAAKNKDAIQYVVNGRSSQGVALDIKADAENPGGITATGKAIVSHIKPSSNAPSKDRPITRFYGGIFNASYVVKQGATNFFGLMTSGYTGASAPAFYFYGGEYNGTIYTNRSLNQFHGGTFNGSMSMSVDSSAYTLVAGGTFKNLSNSVMRSELNSDKFTIGSAKGVYDKEVYIDDDGYMVIAAAEPAQGIEAGVTTTPNTTYDYLAYSKVATEGSLNYTDVYMALEKNTSAEVTVYVDELDMAKVSSNFKGTIVVPENESITITAVEGAAALNVKGSVTYVDADGKELVKGEDGKLESAAPAVTNVAEINGVGYATFAEALTAAAAMTDDVTVEIYEKVTLNGPVGGDFDSITFVGVEDDAEIYMDIQGAVYMTGKTVAFENLTLSKVAGDYAADAGFMNLAFGVYNADEVTYTDCIFTNGAYASYGVNTFTGCTFYRSHDRYGLWAYGAEEVIVDGCTFADIRGIKVYDEGMQRLTGLTVTNTDFSAVDNKPAIVLTSGKSVTLSGNTYNPDKGVFELDLDGNPDGTPVTSTDAITCVNDNGACGVLVDGKIYTTVAQAADVAASGSNVTLLHDSAETVEFAEGVELDKNGFDAAGVTVKQPAANVAEVNGEKFTDLQEAIKAAAPAGTVELLSDVTVDKWSMISETLSIGDGQIITLDMSGLTIDGNGYTLTVNAIESATNGNHLIYDGDYNVQDLTIEVADGVRGGLGITSGTIRNVTFIGGDVGVLLTDGLVTGVHAGAVTIEDCTFKVNGNAIYYETAQDDLVVNGNTFEIPSAANVIVMYGAETFTNNTVVSGRTVNVASGSPVVTGNDFGDVRFKVYNEATATIENNTINNLVFNDATAQQSTFANNTMSESAQAALDAVTPKVAKIGDVEYATLEEAAAAAKAGDEIKLIGDATLSAELTLPAGITLNGNGYQINGNIVAGGDLTIKGHTKATSFNAGYNKPTITIGEGACLEMNGTGRMVIGHGATFNITGTIENAKTADKATLTPSLIMPGASFTGAGVTFNVTNAYIKAPSSYCSSSKSASGIFDFNITNSIWETAGKLAFESQSTAATVNFELKDSVLATGSHLVFGVSKGEIVIDNSNVNVGTSRQIENQSTMTIKNGSVVNGAVATSSNAKNPGTIIVDNATYAVSGEFSGSDLGTGKLVLKNGANATVPKFGNATVELGAGCTLTTGSTNVSITTEPGYEAKYENGAYTAVQAPVAQIGETKYYKLEDAFKAATSGCEIDILTDVTVDYYWDCRYTGSKFTVPVTINGNDHTLTFTNTVYDAGNHMSAFRFEADAEVNDLTIDMSEALSGWGTRIRAISAKGNLTVDNCTFIGNGSANNTRAIIFGEGGTADSLANVAISVTNSTFTGWRQAIGDNEGGKTEVKTVVITGNTMNDAGVNVSAFDSITFTDNTVEGKYVKLVSYTADNALNVTATDNTLTANTESDENYIKAGGTVEAQDEFVVHVEAVAEVNGVGYATLAEAIAAAQVGDTVKLLTDVAQVDGIVIDSKNLTIDLNGKTFTVTEGASTNNRNFKIVGTSVVTIKNGTMIAAGDYSTGAYGTVRTEGAANVTLTGLKLYNYRGNGLNIKACAGTTVTVTDTEIYSQYGGGVEAAGGTVELTNVTVKQKGMYTAPYNSMAISVNGGGKAIVNSGIYTTECLTAEEANGQGTSHGPWVIGVLNSGGTLIVNGGTFANDNFGDNDLAHAARGMVLADTAANVQINGGTFTALKNVVDIQNNLGDATKNPVVTLAGGTFSSNPTNGNSSNCIKVAEGYEVVENADGTYGIVEAPTYLAEVNGVKYTTLSAAFAAVKNDNDIVTILGDVTEELAGAYLRGNITTKDGAKVTINLTNSDWVYLPYTFVVGENVTLKAPALFYYAGGAQINGTVVTDAYYQRYAGTKLTINEPGSLTVNTEMFYLRYTDGDPNAGIYVVGDNNDETIGLNASVIYFYQGMINAKDANIKTSVYWQTNGSDDQGSANLVLDNTKMNVTVNEQDVMVTGTSTATLKNGSVLTCAGGFVAAEDSVSVQDTSKIIYNGGTITAPAGLAGAGTEAEPYLIKSLADLILFRDSVNAGETKYNAEGVYVALDADIDLAGQDWSVNIGDDCNATFDGIFDGKGHTISNLTAVETAKKGDGYVCGGLFGAIYGSAVIKNLTIENVTIEAGFTGNNVGAVVGFAYNCTGSIENVKVTGDIAINAAEVTGVGAIVGYDYYGKLTVKNCSVVGDDGSYITGAAYVGGVIGYASSNSNISNNTVKNVDITGKSCVGGVAGIMLGSGKADSNCVKNVALTATHENWQNSAAAVVGAISGGAITVSNTTVENVTANGAATAALVGSQHAEKPTTPVAKVEAKIGDKYYATLEAALAAAQTGETVELLAPIVVAAGESLTLNKAVTIAYTSNVPGEDMITNRGTLVIDGATLVYTNTDTTGSNVTVSTISCEPGSVLTVNSGVVKNDSANNSKGGAGSFAYAIDLVTNGGLGDVTATINGGEVISTNYMAIRQFVNGETCKNTLTVNGGTIQGATRGINIQLKNNMAYTTINGGTIEGDDYSLCFLTTSENLSVTGGEFKGDVWYSGTDGFITGGTFDREPDAAYAADGYEFAKNADDTWGVVEAAELFDFAQVNMRMGENLSLIFYFKQDCITDTDLSDYVAKISVDYKDERGAVSSEIAASEWMKTSEGTPYYVVEVSGLAAKEMADNVTITICKGEEAVSMTRSMSLRQYGELVLRTSKNDEFKTTVVDMLNYGAKAQEYFEYNTDDLANSGIGDYQSLATANEAVKLGMKNSLVSGTAAYLASFNMRFVSDITMIFGVTEACAAESAKITFINHLGKNVETVVEEFAISKDEVSGKQEKMFEFAGMVVADIDQVIRVEFFDADGNSLLALDSSINAYLTAVQANSKDEKMKELSMEFGKFATSAYAYQH